MGISTTAKQHEKLVYRREPVSRNPELRSLHKLFDAVARKTTHPEYAKIADRLKKSRNNRPPVSLHRLVEMTASCHHKVAVVVAKVVGDDRVLAVPHKITLACLSISESAKRKIEKYGGSVHTLDELFKLAPRPEDMVIFSGPMKGRRAFKYFGDLKDKKNPAFPRTISDGRKKEKRVKRKQK